ncbi:hypothetical protein NEOLEDRAFT_1055763 [Neolentinus lepideus HHB14362 ss-1]|uniref:Arrestin-like N-terminal domain-containing protein n=1 Tax=Neolentinus lepideus HHB14362 ss-1 TaxID=1314782 RepID=A0A165VIS5_9AGAM|nr:hypothetical protein NEOLEDRAFT_1055763 [Neolentinus lepideus HHB14362 ss-1]
MDAINFNTYLDNPYYTAPAVNHGNAAEHQYSLDNKGRPWLELNIANTHHTSAGGVPRFFDGDVLEGSVGLDLEKAKSVKKITVTLLGIATVETFDPLNFVEITETLWDQRQNGGSSRLSGHRSWPFSFTFPHEVTVKDKSKGHSTTYRLPPSFSEKGWNASISINYKILVSVHEGSFSPNAFLAANLFVLPKTVAKPPSSHRRKAYNVAAPLPGPEIDPEGWTELRHVIVKGIPSGSRAPQVTCTLAIAKPLTYALGSPIPLILTLASPDAEALESLADSACVKVVLERFLSAGTKGQLDASSTKDGNTLKDFSSTAVFWPIDEPEEGVRRLQGEIDVPHNLRPSCAFATILIKYAVALLPFQAPGFHSDNNKETPLVKQEVAIVTLNADGVVPRSYAPPPPYVGEEQCKLWT